jgi:hypothetical protein
MLIFFAYLIPSPTPPPPPPPPRRILSPETQESIPSLFVVPTRQSLYFKTFMEPRNRFQGMNSASLCSLAGRYDNPIPTRFLAPTDTYRLAESIPRNLFLGSLNVYKYGLWTLSYSIINFQYVYFNMFNIIFTNRLLLTSTCHYRYQK